MNKKKIAIIGGGAAGFFSAIHAAENNPGAEVTIYEATNNLLAKVLISGGGRCNVTNNTLEISELIKNYPRGAKELRGAFSRFATKDTIEWFKNKQVRLKVEPDNRMFPITDSSTTIAECLIDTARKLKVKIITKQKITKITKTDNKFELIFSNESKTIVNKIILTTGGTKSSFELPKSLGHTITELIPSLFSFEINDNRFKDLAGVSFPNIKLGLDFKNGKKFNILGPVLITHWGLSGPATIKLSAFAAQELFHSNYQAELKINFLPEYNFDTIFQILTSHREKNQNAVVQNDAFLNIPKRFWTQIVQEIENKDRQIWNEFSKKQLQQLAVELTQAKYQITAKGKFKDEFVTCGGVSLKEIDFTKMESKITPGLFFAGEVLDIDGITGGFNFQSAWTTAWIAGNNI